MKKWRYLTCVFYHISEIDEDLLTIKVVVGLVSLIVIFVAVVILFIIYTLRKRSLKRVQKRYW
jgi:hypothetical protein